MKEMQAMVQEITNKLCDVEQRMSDWEDNENTTNESLIYLLEERQNMREKIDYLGNKSRQNNIRIF